MEEFDSGRSKEDFPDVTTENLKKKRKHQNNGRRNERSAFLGFLSILYMHQSAFLVLQTEMNRTITLMISLLI
jgi:hypothetical protein